MAKFPQPSMSGGELTPGLHGRVDLVRYTISLARARNVFTKPTGGVQKRPGTRFRGYVKFHNRKTRLIRFVYSTQVRYVIEMGHNYFRFWVDGALLTNSTKTITGITNAAAPVVSCEAHGFAVGDQVLINGVRGMTRINGRVFTITAVTTDTFTISGIDTTADPAYYVLPSGVSSMQQVTAGRIVEVATPYTEDMIGDVRFTQSADVLYLVHHDVAIKELRRIASAAFVLRDFPFKRGPFRAFNSDEAVKMTVTRTTGETTVSVNVDTFTPGMVGMLIYMEEKELRDVKPWASGEKNVFVGATRRSDQKVYRCYSIPANRGSKGTPYWVSGAQRPVHTSGRAFDGPQDVKDDGVNSYAVGVEWEFLHNVFGIVQVTEYVNAKTVKGIVVERVPDSIIGSIGSPANEWNLTGDGVTKEFTITGANSDYQSDYLVTINGVPVQPNPYYNGGGGVIGNGGGNVRPGGGGSTIVVVP